MEDLREVLPSTTFSTWNPVPSAVMPTEAKHPEPTTTRNDVLNIPLVSSTAMDTPSPRTAFAIAMAQAGGMGVIYLLAT